VTALKTLTVEKARDMLARAKSLDEVKHIRDVALAMKTYARTQKAGKQAELDAGEIAFHAELRLGELDEQIEKEGGPGRGK